MFFLYFVKTYFIGLSFDWPIDMTSISFLLSGNIVQVLYSGPTILIWAKLLQFGCQALNFPWPGELASWHSNRGRNGGGQDFCNSDYTEDLLQPSCFWSLPSMILRLFSFLSFLRNVLKSSLNMCRLQETFQTKLTFMNLMKVYELQSLHYLKRRRNWDITISILWS